MKIPLVVISSDLKAEMSGPQQVLRSRRICLCVMLLSKPVAFYVSSSSDVVPQLNSFDIFVPYGLFDNFYYYAYGSFVTFLFVHVDSQIALLSRENETLYQVCAILFWKEPLAYSLAPS